MQEREDPLQVCCFERETNYPSDERLDRKLIKRIEDLSADSAAVKVHLIPQMKGLTDHVSELVNFGISVSFFTSSYLRRKRLTSGAFVFVQLAQQVMPHLSDVRAAKSPFQLATILSTVKETAIASVAKDLKPTASVWEAISQHVSQLMEDGNKLLPLILEQENVQKSK